MKTYRSMLVLAGCAAAATALAAVPNMKEGMWETTVKMDMPGMPAGMPPQTMQRCMTAQDFADPRKSAGPDRAEQCEVSNYRMQGNTATWEMSCKGPEQMRGSGSVTYEGERYAGTNRMTMVQGGKPLNMTMTYTGRYLGACKAGQK